MEARKLSDLPAPAFELSLRIRHPSIDPATISQELQLEPEHSFRAGEPRASSSGLAATAVHQESYWLASLDPFAAQTPSMGFEVLSQSRERVRTGQSLGVDGALALCATHFGRRHTAFFHRIVSEGGEVCLLIELSPDAVRTFAITPAISRSMAELGIALEFGFAPSA
jgi:hypothetical protein